MCASPLARPGTVFIGFYGVDPKYQGLGIGRKLWTKTLGRLDPSLNVGLYGVPEMVEKYRNSGFVVEDSISLVVFENERPVNRNILKDLNNTELYFEIRRGNIEDNLITKIVEYDQTIHGHSRELLLNHYLNGDEAPITIVVLKKDTESCCDSSNMSENDIESSATTDRRQSSSSECNKILGFGCIRKSNSRSGMIGPIYSDSDDISEAILKNLMIRFSPDPDQVFTIMPLSSNERAVAILQQMGFEELERCPRMFTKFVPSAPSSKIFCVHSPNFSLF